MTEDDQVYLTAMVEKAVKAAGIVDSPQLAYQAYAERFEERWKENPEDLALALSKLATALKAKLEVADGLGDSS